MSDTVEAAVSHPQRLSYSDHTIDTRKGDLAEADPQSLLVKTATSEATAAPSTGDTIIEATEHDNEVEALQSPAASQGPIELDPKTSERQYYRDSFVKLQREIWRPGNSDRV